MFARRAYCTKPTASNYCYKIGSGATFVRPRCTSRLCRRARAHATAVEKEGGRPLSEPAPATPTNLTRFVHGTTLWRGFVVIAIIAKSASRHAPTKQLRLLGNEIRPTTRPAKTPLTRQVRTGRPRRNAHVLESGSLGTTCERGASSQEQEGMPRGKGRGEGCPAIKSTHVLRQIQTCRSAPFWIQSHMH